MSNLADDVCSLIRTRADLHRYSASNAHGLQMHQGIDLLEAALPTADPKDAYTATHKALASALKVIVRADDSAGIIGDACRRLLDLHPRVAAAAQVPPKKLVDWMMKFQFGDNDADYFELDPVAYAPALGATGMAMYRGRLAEVTDGLGVRPKNMLDSSYRHEWFTVEWNERRLAVLDRDVEAIIHTHLRDGKVAAWHQDVAEAFEEIGRIDLALEWARRAMEFDRGHQSAKAGQYWCRLLEQHRPDDVLQARLAVFRKWPSAPNAGALYGISGNSWPQYAEEVAHALASNPREAVTFAITTLDDPRYAWRLAHELDLDDTYVWNDLADMYSEIDPIAVLPIHRKLVELELVDAGADHYRRAARRLSRMRSLASGRSEAAEVDSFILRLRETHKRRPRLQQEFDKARLPCG